ncbi:MAG: replicative DNA helicase [Campylobacteraceae bacterium]|jgi:replicative DNA helicase|nr:replicative DNA helicase [Campylobacteraceae bacterium]
MDNLHNINMERSILSSIIFNPMLFEEVSSRLNPIDFYLPAHRYIFSAMLECERDDLPIDEEFLKKTLNQNGTFDENAMLDILSTNWIPNVGAYVQEIKEKSIKRQLIALTGDINDVAIEKDLPAREVVDIVQQKLYQITQESGEKEFRESPEMTHSAIEYIKEMKSRGNSLITGIDTGFHDLNRLTTGFNNGDFIIIAARPAMGKTAFCLNIAGHCLDNNKGVAIFSLEMPAEQLMLRMLSAKTSIALQNLKVGNLTDEEWERLSDAADDFSKKKFFVNDQGNVNIHHIRGQLRKLKMKHPEISICIIDYLQLMTSVTSGKERHLEVSDISRGLKLLARELDMPIIALSQLNRSLESRSDRRPMLSDIRESGSIEQDADIILFVYRDDVYKQKDEKEKEERSKKERDKSGNIVEYKSKFIEKPTEEAEIIIGKNRNGPTGVAHLLFHKAYVKFVNNNKSGDEQDYQNTKADFINNLPRG